MSLWDKIIGGVGKAFGAINPIGGLLSAGSTLVGGLSAIGQLKRQKKMADYEQQLAEQMYEKQWADQQAQYERELADQRQLIQEERDYNDFSSVMARASKAGVNKLAALGQSTGIGMQSSAGSAPSASTPSASSGRVGSPDNIGNTLINAGSTLSAQIRQQELLSAEKRKLEAEAQTAEIEALWRDRKLREDVESSQAYQDYTNAQVGTEQERKRLVSAQADVQESLAKFQETRNMLDYQKAMSEIDVFVKTARGLEIKNEYQAELLQAEIDNYMAQIAKTNAEIYSITQVVEQNWKELGLKEEDLKELKRHNKALEEQDKAELAYAKERDKADRKQKYWQMGLNFLTDVADVAVGAIMPVGKILGKIPAGKLESVLTTKGVGDLTMAKNLQQFGGISY